MATVASDLQGSLIPQAPAPVEQTERITALDTVRGFALLGILLMNIIAMGMFGGAYDDPVAAGGSTGGIHLLNDDSPLPFDPFKGQPDEKKREQRLRCHGGRSPPLRGGPK